MLTSSSNAYQSPSVHQVLWIAELASTAWLNMRIAWEGPLQATLLTTPPDQLPLTRGSVLSPDVSPLRAYSSSLKTGFAFMRLNWCWSEVMRSRAYQSPSVYQVLWIAELGSINCMAEHEKRLRRTPTGNILHNTSRPTTSNRGSVLSPCVSPLLALPWRQALRLTLYGCLGVLPVGAPLRHFSCSVLLASTVIQRLGTHIMDFDMRLEERVKVTSLAKG